MCIRDSCIKTRELAQTQRNQHLVCLTADWCTYLAHMEGKCDTLLISNSHLVCVTKGLQNALRDCQDAIQRAVGHNERVQLECAQLASDAQPPQQELLAMRKELKEVAELSLCKVCWNNIMCMCSTTCNHLCVCFDCSEQLEDCPICRMPVTSAGRRNAKWTHVYSDALYRAHATSDG